MKDLMFTIHHENIVLDENSSINKNNTSNEIKIEII